MSEISDIDILGGGKPIEGDGTPRIYNGLLAKLANLQPGEVLRLQAKNGRAYAIVNWDDAITAFHIVK